MCWTARAFPRLLADCANEVEEADFNGDGLVDTKDLIYLSRNIGNIATVINNLTDAGGAVLTVY